MIVASLIAAVTFWSPAPEGWTADLRYAVNRAKAEKKLMLVDFTGSDWCSFCKVLRKEVFDTDHFKTWAKKNVVLVELDYPKHKRLPDQLEQQNAQLGMMYSKIVSGYPTILLIEPNGKPFGKFGYSEGGAEAWTAQIDKALAAYQPDSTG
jgi:thioredoxin-related protein